MNDLDIARRSPLQPIQKIAEKLHLQATDYEPYGHYKAKINLNLTDEQRIKKSRLILVSALSPTPAGEGKTTISVGLNDGLCRLGAASLAVLREPSLGPVFGMKGGATGGGYAQLQPMEDINLHFNGDFAAVEKAHNLLSAAIDNHLHHRRSPQLDPRSVSWKRVMDMNDRALRQINVGLGGPNGGVPRESGFDITAASEVMAILCLARDPEDLKKRLGRIYVGRTYDKEPVYAADIGVTGAMAALLQHALKPNLVQSLEGNPALLHGGPFANIAQGTNTLLATRLGMSLADYVVTEAGFGFDLGGEKFLDIKARLGGLSPRLVVLVTTVRALKYQGGTPLDKLNQPDPEAVRRGREHLTRHLENIKRFGLTPLVALNPFTHDSTEEWKAVEALCQELSVACERADAWGQGGAGAEKLARRAMELCETPSELKFLYPLEAPVEEKITRLARDMYGASEVKYSPEARKNLRQIARLGDRPWSICMAKTEKSFSDDPQLRGAPSGHTLHIRAIEVASGAGFVVPIAGSIMRMPGLPREPAALQIDLTEEGVTGLF